MKTIETSDIVFVYGALRSGTTVFRLMLDAHPDIANPGEMDFMLDHISIDPTHPTGWRYDLDGLKLDRIYQHHAVDLPKGKEGLDLLEFFLDHLRAQHSEKVLSINIHRHMDRVLAMIPNARLIHMLRDPRDVARSSIVMGWAGTTYHAVKHWMATEQALDDSLAGKDIQRMMTLKYETLFRDTEGTLKEVCAFLDLSYAPQIMNYYQGTTYSAPDPTLVQQWRKKADPQDMALLEYRAKALMELRGYPPEMPPVHPSLFTRSQLELRNKIFVWRFGIQRHGLRTFVAEKVTRRLRLRSLHKVIKQRMNDNDAEMVK